MKIKLSKNKRSLINRMISEGALLNLDPESLEIINDLMRGHEVDVRDSIIGHTRSPESLKAVDTMVQLLDALRDLGLKELPHVRQGDARGAFSVFSGAIKKHMGDIRWALDMSDDRDAISSTLQAAHALVPQLHSAINASSKYVNEESNEKRRKKMKGKMMKIKLSELKKMIREAAAPVDHPMWEVSPLPSPREKEKEKKKKKSSLDEMDRYDFGEEDFDESSFSTEIDETLASMDASDELHDRDLDDIAAEIHQMHGDWIDSVGDSGFNLDEHIKSWLASNGYRLIGSQDDPRYLTVMYR